MHLRWCPWSGHVFLLRKFIQAYKRKLQNNCVLTICFTFFLSDVEKNLFLDCRNNRFNHWQNSRYTIIVSEACVCAKAQCLLVFLHLFESNMLGYAWRSFIRLFLYIDLTETFIEVRYCASVRSPGWDGKPDVTRRQTPANSTSFSVNGFYWRAAPTMSTASMWHHKGLGVTPRVCLKDFYYYEKPLDSTLWNGASSSGCACPEIPYPLEIGCSWSTSPQKFGCAGLH